MAQCDVQSLLDDAACFAAVNPGLRSAAMAVLWCNIAEGLANLDSPNPALQSVDDNLWYRFNITEISPGVAVANPGQVAVDPDANPYLVLTDIDDGLKYKLSFFGVPPNVFWQIDGVSVEPETPTVLFAGSNGFTLQTADSGTTIDLSPAP